MEQKFKCPKCGGQQFYSTIRGIQYYNEFMEPCGYIVEQESKTIRCISCGSKCNIKRDDRNK